MDFDPYDHDPQHWGVSLSQSAELMLPVLDAAQVRSIYEVGAFAGDLTRVLVAWAAQAGATVGAIDPSPQPGLEALERDHPELQLIRETSIAALPTIPLPDAVIIDGDHNWYTVTEELRLIAQRAGDAPMPLLLFHDVCWPHARRDDYYAAELIPEDARHPVAGAAGGIFPGDPGVRKGGLPYPKSAAQEGGPRNGVLTAVEDFVAGRDDLRLVVVPVFFGFGVVFPTAAPWAGDVAAILDPWDRHPILERLEANRVHQLATQQVRQAEIWALRERLARHEAVLQRLLQSSAFRVAERLSGLRKRAGVAADQPAVSRDEIRRTLS